MTAVHGKLNRTSTFMDDLFNIIYIYIYLKHCGCSNSDEKRSAVSPLPLFLPHLAIHAATSLVLKTAMAWYLHYGVWVN